MRVKEYSVPKKNGRHLNGSNSLNKDSNFEKPDAIEFVKPLISVIVPAYQEEKIILNTIKIFTDEFKEKFQIELIVSDGGSNDKTIEIAKLYADKIVKHEKTVRQTISEGRNRGALAAEGSVLVFLNADSMPADPDSFFEFITAWAVGEKYKKNYDALACYVTAMPGEVILKDRIFYTVHNYYVRLLNAVGIGMGRGECQIVKKDVFKSVGGYNDKIIAGEDFDLYRRISKVGKIGFEKNLVVCESPRRFRKYGYLKTIFYWLLNSLSVMYLGKSVSKEWEAVR